jgi:RND family efflux transporter MFP subunit
VASVEPVTRSTLAAEQEGLVAERSFDEGQSIKKGEVLARMKTDLLEAQLAAAEAAKASAEATVARAGAESDNAAKELRRVERLVGGNVGTEKELRTAETAAQVKAADVQVGRAAVLEKAAEVERLKLQIAKSQVVAPIHGVVLRRHVEVGQWVEQGDAVAEVVQLDPLFVRVAVPESVIARVRTGDKAEVTIDALADAPGGGKLEGKVEQILPEADPSSRTFSVKILLPNPENRIRPGFFGRASLLSQSEAVLMVPKDAVVARGTSAHVVAARDGKAVLVPVRRGAAEGDLIAVTALEGGELGEKDLVVTRGNEQLLGGETLIFQPPTATPATTTATSAAAAKAGGDQGGTVKR